MTLCFAVNHGVCTTPLIVASSLLGEDTAYVGSGILYVAAVIGSLFVAAPVCAALGLRRALVAGTALYCVYVGGFAICLCVGKGSWLQGLFWIACSAAGGTGGAIVWTAQGAYFAETGAKLAELTGEPPEAEKASLAGSFSFWYLVLEVLAKVCFSLLQDLGLQSFMVSFLYFALGLVAVLVLSSVQDMESSSLAGTAQRVLGVISLWSDPLIWLLSPVNLTFGFSAAFMNGFVNAEYLKVELGEDAVAAVGAITPLVAAVGAKVFGYAGGVVGKGPVVTVGSLCFLCIPLCLLLLGCCEGWGLWMVVLYVFQGLGRAVYESTNRAAFADFFTGPDTQGAFGNCALQSNLAFAACFFLQTSMHKVALAIFVMSLAGVTPLLYAAARAQADSRGEKVSADAE